MWSAPKPESPLLLLPAQKVESVTSRLEGVDAWSPCVRADRRKAWGIALTVGLGLWLFYAFACALRLGGETALKDFSNLLTTCAALVGSLCCLACAWFGPGEHKQWSRAWLFMAAGWAFNALGEAQWVLVETLQRREVPSPGWADVFFELAYPCLFIGLAYFFAGSPQRQQTRVALDCALVASSFAALVWFFVLQPMWMVRDLNAPLGTWISLSYPLLDVCIAWAAFVLAQSRIYSGHQQRSISLIALAMGIYACTDLVYSFEEVRGTYQTGGWCDVFNVGAYISVALGALFCLWGQMSTAPRNFEHERENLSLWRVLSPYGFMLAVLGTVTVQQWITTQQLTLSWDVLLWIVISLGLVLTRQLVALVENVHMARELKQLNTGLDQQVQERTRQLDALLQLSKAVNSTLLENDVLQQAALSAREAVRVQAVGIWLSSKDGRNLSLVASDLLNTEQESEQSAETEFLKELLESKVALDLAHDVASCGISGDWRADLLDDPSYKSRTWGAHGLVPYAHLQPICHREQVLGVIGALRMVKSSELAPFASEERRLLENISLDIGTALENARTYSRAVEAADLDPVTGLLNHRAMQDRFENYWARSQTSETPLAVIMMDLNNFKGFNDTYGHMAGDEVLRLVAQTLNCSCRGGDFVGRYGGDEFFMLLPDTDTSGALRVAERLRDTMSGIEFKPENGRESLPITLSFGVASSPCDARTKIELISLADRNLYVAKGSGQQIRGTSEATLERRNLLSDDGIATLDAMVTAISNFDAYTRQHSEDVTEYSLWIAEELGLSSDTLRTVRVGGMLHDVGKICVPQDVLKKPGKLTDEEFAAMKTHPTHGALLVGAILPDQDVLDIVKCHHERFDGRGYPQALSGENIPLLGRIVAVADAFSAMTTSRPYRKALSQEQARLEIEGGFGTQFDPHVAHAFLRALDKRSSIQSSIQETELEACSV